MQSEKQYKADIINRYVYAVTKRLPASQRADIEKELRSLIDDMMTGKAEERDVQTVLLELGKPSELAAKYRESKRYLIGPEYFDTYIMILKIVLAATTFGVSLALIIGYFVTPPQNVIGTIAEFFASVLSAAIQALAWVTVAFAIAERFFPGKDIWEGEKWKLSDLPPVPDKQATIKKSEPIVAIIFSVLLIILFNVAPELFGIYVFSGGQTIIPIFDLQVLKSMLVMIDIIIFLGIAKELCKLLFGKYSIRLAVTVTVINIISVIMAVNVFGSSEIWNGDLITTIQSVSDFSWVADSIFADIWALVPKIISGIIIFGNVVDTVVTISRSTRYAIRDK